MRQRLTLLGSTGSIGEQTLDIVRSNPQLYEIISLTAHTNWQRLAAQAREFLPDSVVIADKAHYRALSDALADLPVKVYAGSESVAQIAASTAAETVVNALVGYAGLEPTVSALRARKKVALANKESLVVAGELVMQESAHNNAPLLPIDSEHSAILQCLAGEKSPVTKVILTASGGPFLGRETSELERVTVSEALAHPNWEMGAKITIDSATMMNKGFEVIEAKWLFGLEPGQIEVLVHPQSIIHSMVEFADGSVKAQLGLPDMKVPIQYALTFPHRAPLDTPRLDLSRRGPLTFSQPDTVKFPALALAYDCMARGGTACCTLNAANETAVGTFLEGRIPFTSITKIIDHTVRNAGFTPAPTMDDYRLCDAEAREIASAHCTAISNR